jgi:hypothetical protein
MNPPFPPSFDVDIETFRQGIVKHRPPCTVLPFIILTLIFRNITRYWFECAELLLHGAESFSCAVSQSRFSS